MQTRFEAHLLNSIWAKFYLSSIQSLSLQFKFCILRLELSTKRQNYGLDQIESICRLFKWSWNDDFCLTFGRKHCGKRRKCWLPAFSPFTKKFSRDFFLVVVNSRDCVIKSVILSRTTNFRPFQIEFADDNFELDKNGKTFSKRVENTVGKKRNCSLRAISPFPNVFSKELYRRHLSRACLIWYPARPILWPGIDDSHGDRIHTSLTTVLCFDNGYVGKQPVAWKGYCAEYWLKRFQESMDRSPRYNWNTVETALSTIESNSQSGLIWERVKIIPQFRRHLIHHQTKASEFETSKTFRHQVKN